MIVSYSDCFASSLSLRIFFWITAYCAPSAAPVSAPMNSEGRPKDEMLHLIACLSGTYHLMAKLTHDSGQRCAADEMLGLTLGIGFVGVSQESSA